MASDPSPEDDLYWENRTLCSDGNCIGVIGPDGRCKECGKPFDGDLPEPVDPLGPHTASKTDEPDAAGAEPLPPEPADEGSGPAPDPEAEEAWENRRLCSDGNCIGVIGPDGRCKECGRPDETAAE